MSNPLSPPYVTHAGNQTLYLAVGTPIVNTLQALTGSVTLTSPDSSITITPAGQSIQLQAVIPSTISNPNPSFSTITMAPVAGLVGNITFTGEGLINYNHAIALLDSQTGNSLGVIYQQAPNGVSTFAIQADEQIWNGVSAYMGIAQDGNQYIWNSGSGKTVLASPTSISSFTVSSINGGAYPPSFGGVSSLNTLTGGVTLLEDGNISITPNVGNGTLTLSVPFGVDSLNGLQNVLSLTSPGDSITITPNSGSGSIELVANFPPVQPAVNALNTLTGDVTLGSDDGSVTIGLLPGNIVDLAVNFPEPPLAVNALNTVSGDVTLTSPDASITITPSGQNIQLQAVAPTPTTVKQATYYKTTAQNLTSGNTDITFDAVGSWNNTGGYITHTNGTTNFTVVQTGLYQLEFNAVVLINNGTWTNTSNKNIAIDVTRPSIAEQNVITNSALMGTQNYGQSVSGTIYLIAGDIINLRIGNTFTFTVGTPPQVQQLQNTFDLNTFFTWTFISS